MLRTLSAVLVAVIAVSAPLVHSASEADLPFIDASASSATGTPPRTAPFAGTVSQRVVPQRLLMRKVPAQRVAGLTEHVAPSCSGTGSDGDRVQVLYVRSSRMPVATSEKRQEILDEVRTVDDVFAASAAKTGGGLRVRWVHDASCLPVIDEVAVSSAAIADGWNVMASELRSLGYDRADRKYLVFTESRRNCGLSDGNVTASISRVDAPCWPLTTTAIAAHELGHALGAVPGDAPHASGWGHCNEAADLMCNGEQDTSDPVVRNCPGWQANWFDCGNDDYFDTDPAPGSFLDSSRNIARSPFLDTVAPLPSAPGFRVVARTARDDRSARAHQGQVVSVQAVADHPVIGWSFPAAPGSCRLVTSSASSALTARASYVCLQPVGTTATITVQALGEDGRVGYETDSTLLRTAPVRFELSGRPRAGEPFTVTAVGGGYRQVLWRWTGGDGCHKYRRGPSLDVTCPPQMSGSSIDLSVTAFRLGGDRVVARREVRLAG